MTGVEEPELAVIRVGDHPRPIFRFVETGPDAAVSEESRRQSV